MMRAKLQVVAALAALAAPVAVAAQAQTQAQTSTTVAAPTGQKTLAATINVYVFPNAGQDAARQSKDESQCYAWAVQNTGSDPFQLAKQAEESGMTRYEAAVSAARTRLRPILMTSLAFILGVVPLVLATGAGAEMRQSLGTAVFAGMLGVTVFGLIFTPVFYVLTSAFAGRRAAAKAATEAQPAAE